MGARENIRKQIKKILNRIEMLEILEIDAELNCEYNLAILWSERIYKYRLDILVLSKLL